MGDQNIKDRPSEVDRQLNVDITDDDFSDESDLFGDDSDIDPTYFPESDIERDVDLFSVRNIAMDQPSTSTQGYTTPRPTPASQPVPTYQRLQDRFRRSQVLSDSSESSDDEVDNEIWEGINEVEVQNFTHNFDFNEIPGPSRSVPNINKPIDFFNLFFSQALLNIFVSETNRYANQKIATNISNASPHSLFRKWFPVTLPEIKVFIAVVLNMGLVRKPSIKSYWNSSRSQSTPWFPLTFHRNRFEALLSFFHVVNNEALPKAGEPEYDPTQKFAPVLDHCNRLFRQFYTGHQQISVDESLIGTKSQTQLMQYLPNKHHHRWGVKLWVLVDSVSNYCLSMCCYKGKKDEQEKESIKKHGLGYTVVKNLLLACNYVHKGYHVFCDNFFTSVNLVKDLYQNKTFFTGTVRKTRKDLPLNSSSTLQVGEKKYWKKQNIVALAYRQKKSQKKPVILLTSNARIGDVENTKRRHGRSTTETKPAAILDYNKYMGGIDSNDMMLYSYLDERRTVKYWKKVVFNLFARMVLNSYIIYKEKLQLNGSKPLTRYMFCIAVIESITDEWLSFRNEDIGGTYDNSSAGNGRRMFGLEKLEGRKEKTCFVCTKRGPDYMKKGRKRSRTVCIGCKEGCHAQCLAKHICSK